MKQKFWNSEKLLSLSALLVSVCTLIVFVYQTNLIRKQQYMSVYPYLNLSNYASGGLNYKYVLSNDGIGPALIKSVKIVSPKGDVYNDIAVYVIKTIQQEDSIWFYHSNVKEGRLIPENQVIPIIQLIDNKTLDSLGQPRNTFEGSEKLYKVLHHDSLQIEITYESIYGESWTITNISKSPTKN